jgi:uncharacterized Zn finger protein
MKTTDRARFDIDTLRELAGDRSFSRGKDYFRDGCVQILSLGSKRVIAEVSGTQDYRTVLTGSGKDIDGECSCPAFGDQGFCKHMVATALAVNAAGEGAEGEADAALSRIRAHLKAKPADQLVEMVLDLAGEHPELFRKLDLASVVVDADDATLEKRLRKAIDTATHIHTYVDYRAAQGWSTGVEAALDAVADIAYGPRANVALRLAEHAIEQIGKAFESIDDSDGHLRSLLGRAGDITWPLRRRRGRSLSHWRAVSSNARWRTISGRSGMSLSSTPTCSASPVLRSIGVLRKPHGRKCRPSRAALATMTALVPSIG